MVAAADSQGGSAGSSDVSTLPLGGGLVDLDLTKRDSAAAADKQANLGSEAVSQVCNSKSDVYYVNGEPVAFTKQQLVFKAAAAAGETRVSRS